MRSRPHIGLEPYWQAPQKQVMTQIHKSRRGRTVVVLAALLSLAATSAVDARAGKGGSLGSRGDRTYDAPATTNTAPSTAAPMQRSATDQPTAARPGTPGAGMQQPAPARRGFFGGLAGGLLGAGLIGMLLGGGFFGGLGGIASILGFLLQIALIGGLIWLAVRFFQRRNQPAMAGAGGPMNRGPLNREQAPAGHGRQTGGYGGAAAGATRTPKGVDGVGIGPGDYEAFEK